MHKEKAYSCNLVRFKGKVNTLVGIEENVRSLVPSLLIKLYQAYFVKQSMENEFQSWSDAKYACGAAFSPSEARSRATRQVNYLTHDRVHDGVS